MAPLIEPLHDLIFALVPEYYVTGWQLLYVALIALCAWFEYRTWRKYQ